MPAEAPRAAILGGFGYVGGRVASHLAERGWGVRITGRSPRPESALPSQVLDLTTDGDAHLDLVLQYTDAVVNCIALNETRALEDPAAARAVAVDAARRVGRAATRLGIRHVLHFSTVHVYGRLQGEIDETSPLDPIHPYAEAHACAESALGEAVGGRTHATVLRVSNGVGPPARPDVDRWTLLTNDLARRWAREARLVLRSPANVRRDFVTLQDVARAVAHLLDAGPGAPVVVNVASGHSEPIGVIAGRMADLAARVAGTRPSVECPPIDPDADEPPMFRISNARLRATGFEFLDRIDEELEGLLRFALRHFGSTT